MLLNEFRLQLLDFINVEYVATGCELLKSFLTFKRIAEFSF